MTVTRSEPKRSVRRRMPDARHGEGSRLVGEMSRPDDDDRRFPRRVYGTGTEPDPRFTLANERTFLAWIRTSLALIAGGVALEAFELPISPVLSLASAVILIALGTLTPVYAWFGWARVEPAALTAARGAARGGCRSGGPVADHRDLRAVSDLERPFDSGLQPERTALAWQRTGLSIALALLVGARLVAHLGAAWAPALAAAGIIGIAVLLTIGHRRYA